MSIRILDEKALFFLKLSIMLSNAVPLLKALEHLEQESYSDALKGAARGIRERFEAMPVDTRPGLMRAGTLAKLMGEYPQVFDEATIELVRSGEQTGNLDLVSRIIPEHLLFARLGDWKR